MRLKPIQLDLTILLLERGSSSSSSTVLMTGSGDGIKHRRFALCSPELVYSCERRLPVFCCGRCNKSQKLGGKQLYCLRVLEGSGCWKSGV